MNAALAVRPEPNVRRSAEPDVKAVMKAHRERVKQAVHPGRTQREAGFTDAERERLACGVLAGITERGERLANRTLVVLAVALLLALGVTALKEPRPLSGAQTVQAGGVR